MLKILNAIHEDLHMHSLNYSDGMNTIDEIVQYADKIWLKKIAITDHSQYLLDKKWFTIRNRRPHTQRRGNVHNGVEVIFGVEWDIIDDTGNSCLDIQGYESEFIILSCHDEAFSWDLKNITQVYSNAIEKYHDKIKLIWHICFKKTSQYLDVETIAKVLNKYNIPIELNTYYLAQNQTDLEKLNKIIPLINAWIYVCSDAHTLNDFNFRQAWFDYLNQNFK